MTGGRANRDWPAFSDKLAKFAKDFAAARNVPLTAIMIHPQKSVAGFKDEQSSAEGQTASNAWWRLSRAADCLVIVVDHLGKDPDAGLRGTSAKETNPLFILSTGETKTDTFCERKLEIRKMRNGRAGLCASFQMEAFDVEIDQAIKGEDGAERLERVTHDTLVVKWGNELVPVGQKDGGRPERDWPESVRDLRSAIVDAMAESGVDHRISDGPLVRTVSMDDVRRAFYRCHIVESDGDT